MFILIKNVEKPKLPKLIWALRKQFEPETLIIIVITTLITTASYCIVVVL